MRRLLVLFLVLATMVVVAAPADAAVADLGRLIDQRLASFRGGASIVVVDVRTGRTLYQRNPDRVLVAASLYKLGILLEAERRVDAGTLAYSDTIIIQPADITADGSFRPAGSRLTVDEALELMITYSDNGSALALRRIFGPRAVNDTLARSGIQPFHIAVGGWEDNVVSAKAVSAFFTSLARRELVSAAASERMLARLGRQHVNDRLPARLPAGTVVAHKTGNLSFVNHDAGIIYRDAAPLVVVAMTWNATAAAAVKLIADLGALVYENAFEFAPLVSYGVPAEAVTSDAGRALLVNVEVTNGSPQAWTLAAPDPITLVWQMRDAEGREVATSEQPLLLPDLEPGGSVELPIVFEVPAWTGDYTVRLGLADREHGPLAVIGGATATFTIRSRPAPAPPLISPASELETDARVLPPPSISGAQAWLPLGAVAVAAILAIVTLSGALAATRRRRERLARLAERAGA